MSSKRRRSLTPVRRRSPRLSPLSRRLLRSYEGDPSSDGGEEDGGFILAPMLLDHRGLWVFSWSVVVQPAAAAALRSMKIPFDLLRFWSVPWRRFLAWVCHQQQFQGSASV